MINIRHVKVGQKMSEKLSHLGAFISGFNFGFTSTTADMGLAENMPG